MALLRAVRFKEIGCQWTPPDSSHFSTRSSPRRSQSLGLLAAVALAASGLMYFGVVGHSQRAMEQAQNGVRAAFIGLALVWGARELVNLVASAAGQTGLH